MLWKKGRERPCSDLKKKTKELLSWEDAEAVSCLINKCWNGNIQNLDTKRSMYVVNLYKIKAGSYQPELEIDDDAKIKQRIPISLLWHKNEKDK